MRFVRAFCSFYMTIILAVVYALAMAVATFIEGDKSYGTAVARDLVYNAIWFDALHVLLAINLLGVFLYRRLYKSRKYHVLLLHFSLVVILFGAGLTRYLGFEGVMHIREGYSSNIIMSNDEYINILAEIDGSIYASHFPVSYTAFKETRFHERIPLLQSQVEVQFISYTPAQSAVTLPTLHINIAYDNETKDIYLHQSFLDSSREIITLGDVNFEISWGPKETTIPFAIYLQDFELLRYAGSNSPSSYASYVIIKDNTTQIPSKIFMNNVLDYRSYRFFQSSYDKDEKGTILSVNNDPGKIPTYIGYGMLIIGFLWGFFAKNGRFRILIKRLQSRQIFSVLAVLISICATNLHAYPQMSDNATSDISQESIFAEPTQEDIINIIDNMKKHANTHSQALGRLLVRDFGGRIKPLDTLAMEVVHKITKKDGFLGLNNVEILLGMMTYYDTFQRIKMFAISSNELKKILGTPLDEGYVSFFDVFDGDNYKLYNYVEEANRKDPSKRSTLEKDIIKLDEKISIAYAIYTAQILVIFPHNDTWLSPADAIIAFDEKDALHLQSMLQNYFAGVDRGIKENIWSDANNALNALSNFQKENASITLESSRISMEIWLNHYDPFYYLTYAYLLIGLLLLVATLFAIMGNRPLHRKINKAFFALLMLCLALHSISLIIRWYVGNHAPWSNAYESMIYISWVLVIAGSIFRSNLALSLGAISAGIALFVAHLGFMDPQISNLVPVLKSYWLNIHVSVITASYGFFGFSFMIGIITSIFFALKNVNRSHLSEVILNLSYINELSLLLGLAFLTVGNFLGGIWANESWGRYWGWDPKETWSLITIVIYALILHLRFIIKSNYAFYLNLASIIGFYFVLMTYFGVNFYLTGKHSYASGESIPIPSFVYVFLCLTIALILLASRHRKLEGFGDK